MKGFDISNFNYQTFLSLLKWENCITLLKAAKADLIESNKGGILDMAAL